MNCCSKRQWIVALATNALDPYKTRALQAHLQTCASCREYLKQVSTVSENLRGVTIRSDIHASETFHRKLAARLRTERSEALWRSALADLRAMLTSYPRAGLATGVVLVSAIGLCLFRPSAPPVKDVSTKMVFLPSASRPEVAPSVSNYQVVANRSFEMLEELLTAQGSKTSPSPPVYTASTVSLGRSLE